MFLMAEKDTQKLSILKNMDCKVPKQTLFAKKFLTNYMLIVEKHFFHKITLFFTERPAKN